MTEVFMDILAEIETVLDAVDEQQLEAVMERIQKNRRVFVDGEGAPVSRPKALPCG